MQKKRTYADRAGYLIMAVAKRRKKIRQMAVEYLGECCQICGYSKYIFALDFHHRDPKTKEFGLSERGLTRSWEKTKLELDKCILVCSNCHREIHAGITQLPTETLEWNEVNCWKPKAKAMVISSQSFKRKAGSETIPNGSTCPKYGLGSASHPCLKKTDEDIVHPFGKPKDYV